MELAVAVKEAHQLVTRGPEAAAQSRSVTAIDLMVHGTYLGMARGELIGQTWRGVLAAVVDGNDLELVGQSRQDLERLGDERLDVLCLVVRREEE